MRKTSAQQLALDLLSRSTGRVQMAAVLSDLEGRIFAWGWNHGRVHAEEHAIARANPKRVPYAMLTLAGRRLTSGNPVHAFPCLKPGKQCLRLLARRRVRVVEYRNKRGEWVRHPVV